MRVAFLGLGLIGGSVARALRRRDPGASIVAWTPTGRGPAAALADGVLDDVARSAATAVEGAELVILAAPALDCLDLLDGLAGPWRSSLSGTAVITDVASTKAAITSRAASLGLRFVGGHPMAGRETSGYGASSAELLEGCQWVVVPPVGHADDEAVVRVEALATTCGGHPVRMAAGDHDRAVAAVSHLPLIVAASLVEAMAGGAGEARVDWPVAASLAAGGWRDSTRLARGEPAMGAGIVVTNAEPISSRLRDLLAALGDWADMLDAPDEGAVTERLAAARRRLEESTGREGADR
jgi:prephenate dehydrogenase